MFVASNPVATPTGSPTVKWWATDPTYARDTIVLAVTCRSRVRLKFSAIGSLTPASRTPQQKLNTGRFPFAAVNATFCVGPPYGKGLVTVTPVAMSWNGFWKLGLSWRTAPPLENTPRFSLIAKGGIPTTWSACSVSERSKKIPYPPRILVLPGPPVSHPPQLGLYANPTRGPNCLNG